MTEPTRNAFHRGWHDACGALNLKRQDPSSSSLSRAHQLLPDHSQKIADCGSPTTSAVYNPGVEHGKTFNWPIGESVGSKSCDPRAHGRYALLGRNEVERLRPCQDLLHSLRPVTPARENSNVAGVHEQ